MRTEIKYSSRLIQKYIMKLLLLGILIIGVSCSMSNPFTKVSMHNYVCENEDCSKCHGSGVIGLCHSCQGTGRINNRGSIEQLEICQPCKGSGKILCGGY